MNYLIFRSDRIGDFLIISSLIKSIKNNSKDSKIFIVASEKNAGFIKQIPIIDEVLVLNRNSLVSKIKVLLNLKRHKFDAVIVSDKKNSSIIISLFLTAKIKIFNVSKTFQKNILSLFYKKVFLDNDNITIRNEDILKENARTLQINFKNTDFNFFYQNQFKNEYLHTSHLDLNKLNFFLLHYDEKWELEKYKEVYNKSFNFTDMQVDFQGFIKLLGNISGQISKTLIITTGIIKTNFIEELKKNSTKINDSIYQFDINGLKAYLIVNENFFSMIHLISKSKLFISCHGAFTHIAFNYNIKIIDIIEKNKINHYKKITGHMTNHFLVFRQIFNKLSNEILLKLK